MDANADADVHIDGTIDDAVGMSQQLVHAVPVADPAVLLWLSCFTSPNFTPQGQGPEKRMVRRPKGVFHILQHRRQDGIVPSQVSIV